MCASSDSRGEHRPVEICADGLQYYSDALQGRVRSGDCPSCLLDLGLVQHLPDGSLAPIPPRLAGGAEMDRLERAIEEKRSSLGTLRASIAKAQEIYLDSYGKGDSGLIRVVQGSSAISATLSAAVHACQEELLTAQPGGQRPQELLDKALTSDLAALERGVAQRTIYQHMVRSHQPTLTYAERIVQAGGEIRTLDEVFNRLIVCDRRIAFIPDPAAERSEIALAVEHPGVVRYLVSVFDHAWQRASPMPAYPSNRLPPLLTDEVRRAILRHMVNGYTDEAIAARLGMSTRSVANHMRWAAELFGSRSRAQLAYLIARSGFLEDASE
ncbi:LuxR C-terminal-related transcriptional regulator [Streptacidiphilus neutrinimicus]|uniref:LuxR C-terminal-related transcriptional regulator n=1 Tax=Streptacidiphilus neutrinimicus TaxID=105420 RepID=UPI0005A73AB7|nr:LuxR C-terminal-related transcriptional regulator [Streptacidiphilus neutrinimicus]